MAAQGFAKAKELGAVGLTGLMVETPGDPGRALSDGPQALPLGDLEDITQLGPEQVTGGDRDAMLALAARYGADDVLIARATPVAAPVARAASFASGAQTTSAKMPEIASAVAPASGRLPAVSPPKAATLSQEQAAA